MSFSSKANKYFPGVEWHGGSDIHVSVCWNAAIATSDRKQVLALLEKATVGSRIYRHLNKKFENLVWLISPEEFSAIFMVDCYNHMHSKSDSRSPNKITNPHTGNKFHRIAVLDDLVFGIRFWCDAYGDDEHVLGWRFRIVSQDEEEEETRRRVRETAIEAVEEHENVLEYIFDVAEPSTKVIDKVEQMIATLEE